VIGALEERDQQFLMAQVPQRQWFLLLIAQLVGAQIHVLSPEYLSKQFSETHGKIQGSTATFGAPFYGDRVLGRLVWGESRGENHCKDKDYDIPELDMVHHPTEHSKDQARLINIVMVRRGKCSFVTKVKVASAKGAHAVIIVDREDSTLTSHDLTHIIVADDGYGSTISIPSILISKQDGQPLIDAAKSHEVIIELSWEVPIDHTVRVDMWMSAGSHESQKFLKEFAKARRTLNEVLTFTPHYHVFGANPELGGYSGLCTDESAKYCATDPDASGRVTGKDVLDEDVRQLCIHEQTRVPRSRTDTVTKKEHMVFYAGKWWDYVEKLPVRCPLDGTSEEAGFGSTCSYKLMDELGIESSKVMQCATATKDAKLESERTNQAWSPRALRVNGWRYNGMLSADLVTRAICSGFVKSPPECDDLLNPRNPETKYKGVPPAAPGMTAGTIVVGLFTVATIVCCAIFIYRHLVSKNIARQIREEVMLEVNNRMDQYNKLPSGEK
jgi:hypothetical protein